MFMRAVGTCYLRGRTLKFQQDQGAGTLHNVEVKQEGFVPGVGGGQIELVKTLHLLGPEMAQVNLSSISGNHVMEEKYRFLDLHMGIVA